MSDEEFIYEDENGVLTDSDGYLVDETGKLLETEDGDFITRDELYAWHGNQAEAQEEEWIDDMRAELEALQGRIERPLTNTEFDRLVAHAQKTGQGPLEACEAGDNDLVFDFSSDDGRADYMSAMADGGELNGVGPVGEDAIHD
jgi:hypothetical protein